MSEPVREADHAPHDSIRRLDGDPDGRSPCPDLDRLAVGQTEGGQIAQIAEHPGEIEMQAFCQDRRFDRTIVPDSAQQVQMALAKAAGGYGYGAQCCC